MHAQPVYNSVHHTYVVAHSAMHSRSSHTENLVRASCVEYMYLFSTRFAMHRGVLFALETLLCYRSRVPSLTSREIL